MRNCNTLRPLRSQRHRHFWGEEVTWNKSTLVVARSWFLQNMHSYGRQSMSCKYLRFSGMRKSCSRNGIKPMCVFVVNLRNSNTLLPLWSQRHRHFWWWKSIGNCKHFWPQSSSDCSSGAPLSTNQPRESNIEWYLYKNINVELYKAFTRLKSQALFIEVDRLRS